MTKTDAPSIAARLVNGSLAAVVASAVLAFYWPVLELTRLHRADLQLRGQWADGHILVVTDVSPGGVASRAGLQAGDILQFSPRRPTDWILAGYRSMPEGFTAPVSVRRPDGTGTTVWMAPHRAAFLPRLSDRISLVAFLSGSTIFILLGAFLVWARPGMMTWSLLLAGCSTFPYIPWGAYYLAFHASEVFDIRPYVASMFVGAVVMFIPFAAGFQRSASSHRNWRARVMESTGLLGAWVLVAWQFRYVPFEQDIAFRGVAGIVIAGGLWLLPVLAATFILVRGYRRSDPETRARLRWVLLGMSACLVGTFLSIAIALLPYLAVGRASGADLTPSNWALALCAGLFFPLAIGVAVLRNRVIDVQFAVSRTVVYGIVSTLVLTFLATIHWLLGRLIEQSHLAIGLEAVAAIGLGLVLHRTTHAVNRLVDRILFREHHAAEERLRRVTEALPYAKDERTIADALVNAPVSNLGLASAALFYRDSPRKPLQRVLSAGWREDDTSVLDPDDLLVRCLQAEHKPLRLDDTQLMPPMVPAASGAPVLAVPVVNQHVLIAVVLYGAHVDSTLPDPDEVSLLQMLANAAAVSHQQVRIANLKRDNRAEKERNDRLEATVAELRALVSEQAAARR